MNSVSFVPGSRERANEANAAALDPQDRALLELGRALEAASYEFVSVTPESHRRLLARDPQPARNLRDVFGWSRPFQPDALPAPIWALSQAAGVVVEDSSNFKASVRFSTRGSQLLVHSAFPTTASDAVFFGPDTYRFCAYVERCFRPAAAVVDIGCGTGAGGLAIAHLARRVVLADISPAALRMARVNALLARAPVEILHSDVLAGVPGRFDAIIANPPHMRDASRRIYRDGGGLCGEGLSIRIVRESLERLGAGGRLILYTGAPVVAGEDLLRAPVERLCREAGAAFHYEELDPDVFGEQLEEPFYEEVERIAAVGMTARMP